LVLELVKNELKKLLSSSSSFSRSRFLSCEFTRQKKTFLRENKIKPFCGLAKNRFIIIIIIFKELIFWSCKFAKPKHTLKYGSFVHFSFKDSLKKIARTKNEFCWIVCKNGTLIYFARSSFFGL